MGFFLEFGRTDQLRNECPIYLDNAKRYRDTDGKENGDGEKSFEGTRGSEGKNKGRDGKWESLRDLLV